jgi:hypothetical protein
LRGQPLQEKVEFPLVGSNLLQAVHGKDIRLLCRQHPEQAEHRDLALALDNPAVHPDKGVHRAA